LASRIDAFVDWDLDAVDLGAVNSPPPPNPYPQPCFVDPPLS